eukprot:614620_1
MTIIRTYKTDNNANNPFISSDAFLSLHFCFFLHKKFSFINPLHASFNCNFNSNSNHIYLPMTEQCKANGCIQKLVHHDWKTIGVGQLSLIKNTYNPSLILLKLQRKKRNKIHIFQCKPKAKTSGKALILKGTDTKKNQESVLAVRFDLISAMNEFHTVFDQLYRQNKRPSRVPDKRPSMPPQDLKRQLSQYVWDCELCTYRNEPTTFDCGVCNHPRPLKVHKPKRLHSMQDSIQLDQLPEMHTPPTHNERNGSGGLDMITEQPESDNEDSDEDHDEDHDADIESKTDSKTDSKDAEEEKSSIKELITAIINGEDIASIKNQTIEDILLLQHDTFTDSETMLTTLLTAICDTDLVDNSARIRGVRMCESWIKHYWDQDFMYNQEMMNRMDAFIDDLEKNDFSQNDIKYFNHIKKAFEDKVTMTQIQRKRTQHSQRMHRKATSMFGSIDMPKHYDIMRQTTAHISEQITLMDFEIFRKIEKREMTGQAWKSKEKDVRAPHVLEMIKQWECISKWVKCVVLQQKSKKKRARCMEKFIRIAVALRGLRNFSACCAVKFGLGSRDVFRLKAAWGIVSRNEMKQLKEIQEIFQPSGSWPKLRVLHDNAYAPSILHTGLFLQDLFNTDEGNKNTAKDGTVNFAKLHLTYRLIEQIGTYQHSQYAFNADPVIQHYLRTTWQAQADYDDNKMWAISTIVKTRDAEGKEIDASDEKSMAW